MTLIILTGPLNSKSNEMNQFANSESFDLYGTGTDKLSGEVTLVKIVLAPSEKESIKENNCSLWEQIISF